MDAAFDGGSHATESQCGGIVQETLSSMFASDTSEADDRVAIRQAALPTNLSCSSEAYWGGSRGAVGIVAALLEAGSAPTSQ